MSSVAAAFLFTLSLVFQGQQDAKAEAQRLVQAGQLAEALERYQQLAAANPGDLDARLWIARLHREMGHPRRAAAVYESIVATRPRHVEALLGLGLSQMDAGRWREAGEALHRAEQQASESIEVMAALGRYHAAEGRRTLALAYYDRALVSAPDHADIRYAAEAVRASSGHRISVGYDVQQFDGADDPMHVGTLEANFRLGDRFRLFVRGQGHRFDGFDEGRAGGGIEWLAHPSLRMRAGALVGDDNRFLPATDAFADATIHRGRWRGLATIRYFDFEAAELWIGGPGIAVDLVPRLTLQAQYLRGRLTADFYDSDWSDNGMVGITARFTDRVRGSLSYYRGIDQLDWLTVDRLVADDANTLSAGLEADLSPFFTLAGGYDYHDREASALSAHRARAWFVVRF